MKRNRFAVGLIAALLLLGIFFWWFWPRLPKEEVIPPKRKTVKSESVSPAIVKTNAPPSQSEVLPETYPPWKGGVAHDLSDPRWKEVNRSMRPTNDILDRVSLGWDQAAA